MKNNTNHYIRIESKDVDSTYSTNTDAFFILAKDYTFLYLNPQAENLFKLKKEDAIGKSIWDQLPINSQSSLSQILTLTLSLKNRISGNYFSPTNLRWYKIYAFPLGKELVLHFAEIKDHQLPEKKSQKSIVHFRTILDSIPQITYTARPNGEIEYWNKQWQEYTGLSSKEGLSSFRQKAIHPEDLRYTIDTWQKVINVAEPYKMEYRLRRADGEYRWHLERGYPIKDKRGRTRLWVGTATDIQEIEQMYKQPEHQCLLKEINRVIPGIIMVYDIVTRKRLFVNIELYSLLGYNTESITNMSIKTIQKLIHPDDRNRLTNFVDGFEEADDNGIREIEYRAKTSAGRWIWLRVRAKAFKRGKDKKVSQIIAVTYDITREKEIEEENSSMHSLLKQKDEFIDKLSAERSRDFITFMDSIPQIVFAAAPNGKTEYINKRWTEFTGIDTRRSIELEWEYFLHPLDRKRAAKTWQKALQKGSFYEDEYRLRKADGQYRWYLTRALPMKDEKNKIIRWVGAATKIHKQKMAEQELKEREQLLRNIAETTPDIISLYDVEKQRFLYINKELYPLLGYTTEKIKRMKMAELEKFSHPDDWQKYLNYKKGLLYTLNNEIIEVEHRIKNVNNEYTWFKARSIVFKRDGHGKVLEVLSVLQDITAQKLAEKTLHEKEIIEELLKQKDEFLSIASHELKTPVTSMKASLQVLQRLITRKDNPDTLIPFLEKAIKQINKIIDLIADLLDVTKIQAGKLKLNIETFYIQEIISDAIYQQSNSHKITVSNTITEPISGDKLRIEQVLINYLSNAVKYSPNATEIILTVEKEGNFAKISVKDFGIGIPEEKLKNIFQRFYRVDDTSPQFTGLGLGLYISSEIIKAHHGRWGVQSKLDQGSTFWFTIPFKSHYTAAE